MKDSNIKFTVRGVESSSNTSKQPEVSAEVDTSVYKHLSPLSVWQRAALHAAYINDGEISDSEMNFILNFFDMSQTQLKEVLTNFDRYENGENDPLKQKDFNTFIYHVLKDYERTGKLDTAKKFLKNNEEIRKDLFSLNAYMFQNLQNKKDFETTLDALVDSYNPEWDIIYKSPIPIRYNPDDEFSKNILKFIIYIFTRDNVFCENEERLFKTFINYNMTGVKNPKGVLSQLKREFDLDNLILLILNDLLSEVWISNKECRDAYLSLKDTFMQSKNNIANAINQNEEIKENVKIYLGYRKEPYLDELLSSVQSFSFEESDLQTKFLERYAALTPIRSSFTNKFKEALKRSNLEESEIYTPMLQKTEKFDKDSNLPISSAGKIVSFTPFMTVVGAMHGLYGEPYHTLIKKVFSDK